MTERAFRKFIIITGTIIIFLFIIGVLFYFILKPKASCFDNIQNQNETGIDCGGDCVPCEVKDLEKINTIDDPEFLKQGDKYFIYQKVLNSNINWGVKQYNYSFVVSGENKSKEIKGSTYILPKQEKIILEMAEIDFEIKKIDFVPEEVMLNHWSKIEFENLNNNVFEVTNLQLKDGKQEVQQVQQRDIPSYQFTKELKLGDNNDQVKNLQAVLATDPEIYPEGIIDGNFSIETYKAIFRFQYKYDISPANGIINEPTKKKLNELYYYEEQLSSPSYLSFSTELKFGDNGQEVRDLQTTLAKDSEIYPEGIINGEYGYLTRRAVERFQEKYNLEKTGNIDVKTLSKINQVFFEDTSESEIIGATQVVSGKVRNSSIFSFAKVNALVFLCENNDVQAISYYTFDKFYKESSQDITFTWYTDLPDNLNICLTQIETNLFSRDNILK
jgi:peptidoglycan hydrolase-like protein with peptidoglycan-binding domain